MRNISKAEMGRRVIALPLRHNAYENRLGPKTGLQRQRRVPTTTNLSWHSLANDLQIPDPGPIPETLQENE